MTNRDEEGYTIPDQYEALEKRADLEFGKYGRSAGFLAGWWLLPLGIIGGLIWLVLWFVVF